MQQRVPWKRGGCSTVTAWGLEGPQGTDSCKQTPPAWTQLQSRVFAFVVAFLGGDLLSFAFL